MIYILGIMIYWDKKARILEFNFWDIWVKYFYIPERIKQNDND